MRAESSMASAPLRDLAERFSHELIEIGRVIAETLSRMLDDLAAMATSAIDSLASFAERLGLLPKRPAGFPWQERRVTILPVRFIDAPTASRGPSRHNP